MPVCFKTLALTGKISIRNEATRIQKQPCNTQKKKAQTRKQSSKLIKTIGNELSATSDFNKEREGHRRFKTLASTNRLWLRQPFCPAVSRFIDHFVSLIPLPFQMTCVQIELFFFDCLVLAFTLSHLRSVLSLAEQVFSAGDNILHKSKCHWICFLCWHQKESFCGTVRALSQKIMIHSFLLFTSYVQICRADKKGYSRMKVDMIPLVKHTIFICWWLKITVTGTASLQGNVLFTSNEHRPYAKMVAFKLFFCSFSKEPH